MTADRDRGGLRVTARRLPAAGNVSHGVDTDQQAGRVQPVDEVLSSLPVRFTAGQNGPADVLGRIDRPEPRVRLDVLAQTVPIDVHVITLWAPDNKSGTTVRVAPFIIGQPLRNP